MPEVDDARELDRLLRFLTRPGPRFGLALAIYADARAARRARAELASQAEAAGKTVATLTLGYDEGSSDLVARIVEASAGADALIIDGLDSLVVDGLGQQRHTPAVANLNQRRDELPELLDVRAVFWLAKAHYRELTEVAWDLCQVMLSTAEFEAVDAVGARVREHTGASGPSPRPTPSARGELVPSSPQARSPVRKSAGDPLEQLFADLDDAPAPAAAADEAGYDEANYDDAHVDYAEEAVPQWMLPAEEDDRDALEGQLGAYAQVLERASDPRSIADAATSAGQIAVRLGETERGKALFGGAVEALIDAGDPLEAVRQERRVAELHLAADELDEALAATERARALLAVEPDSRRSSVSKREAGAGGAYWDAPAGSEQLEPEPDVAQASLSRGERPEGRADGDADVAQESVTLDEPHEGALELARLELLRAEVGIRSRRFKMAEHALERALEGFVAGADDFGRGQAYAKLAALREREGKLDAALELRQEWELPAYEAAGAEDEAARARTRIADLLARLGEVQPALDLLRKELLSPAAEHNQTQTRIDALSTLANVLDVAGETAAAGQVRRDWRAPLVRDRGPSSQPPRPRDDGALDPNPDDAHIDLRMWLLAVVAIVLAVALLAYVVG